jgi:hypothetical protein
MILAVNSVDLVASVKEYKLWLNMWEVYTPARLQVKLYRFAHWDNFVVYGQLEKRHKLSWKRIARDETE